MRKLKKYKNFLDEKISTAFQSNHGNRLGPGHGWRVTTSWEKSTEMEILPKFIEEYGEGKLEKDEDGWYISTPLDSKIPKEYMGIRVIQSYRESLGFSLDTHPILKYLLEANRGHIFFEKLEWRIGNLNLFKVSTPTVVDLYGKEGDNIILWVENDNHILHFKRSIMFELSRNLADLKKRNPNIKFEQDIDDVLLWFVNQHYGKKLTIFDSASSEIVDIINTFVGLMDYVSAPTTSFIDKFRSFFKRKVNEGFITYDTHSKEELIFVLEQYKEILMMGKDTIFLGQNVSMRNPDKMMKVCNDVAQRWRENDRDIFHSFFKGFGDKRNHSPRYANSVLRRMDEPLADWNSLIYKKEFTGIEINPDMMGLRWEYIIRAINQFLESIHEIT